MLPAALILSLAAITVPGTDAGDGSETRTGVVPPPVIRPVAAEVVEGGEVVIPVSVTPRVDRSADLVIRSEPRLGSVVGVERTGSSEFRILYRHDPEAGGGEDRFLIAARSPRSPVSGSVAVTIRVRPRPARFVVPGEIDFGTRHTLDAARRDLVLRNRGGGIVSGRVIVPDPWRVEGDPSFTLTAGARVVMPLVFEPGGFREYSGVIRYVGMPAEAATRLGARVVPAFRVGRDTLTLERTERGAVAELPLRNDGESERVVALIAPDWLAMPSTVRVPSGSEVSVTVRATDPGPLARSGIFLVAGGGHEEEIQVTLPALPGRIEVTPGSLDFGERREGSAATREVTVRNVGGMPRDLRILGDTGLEIEPESPGRLDPGESLRIRVTHAGDGRTHQRGVLRIASALDQIDVPWTARVLPGPEADGGRSAARAAAAGTARRDGDAPAGGRPDGGDARARGSTMQPNGQSLIDRLIAPDRFSDRRSDNVPPPEDVRVDTVGPREARVSWAAIEAHDDALIEIRGLLLDGDGTPRLHWVEFTDASIREVEGRRSARLGNLDPGNLYRFRISGQSPDGRLSRPVEAPVFATEPPGAPLLTPMRTLLLVTLGLIAAVMWRRWKARRHGR